MTETTGQRLLRYRSEISAAQEAEYANRDARTAFQSAHLQMAIEANRLGLSAWNSLGKGDLAEAYANICLEQLTYLD